MQGQLQASTDYQLGLKSTWTEINGRYSLVLRPAVLEYPTLPLWHVHVQAPLVKFVRRLTACLGG